ncbi:MAG TPA: carbon storage regulator [Pirellulaceae bacterium]|nr:carbon storage regulator [Pirellulaceae bacterium]
MLVLTRKLQERIKIGENVTITVLRVKGNAVRIGIEAPRSVRVIRAELPTDGDASAVESLPATAGEEADVSAEESATADAQPAASPLRFPQRRMINRCGAPPLRVACSQALAASGIMS